MLRHRIVMVLVNFLWPLALISYAIFASITTLNAGPRDETFVIYAYNSGHVFAAVAYSVAAFFAAITIAVPRIEWPRWCFFVTMGFVLIGRVFSNLSYAQGDTWAYRLARTSLTVAAVIAHVIIQVDWLVDRHVDR